MSEVSRVQPDRRALAEPCRENGGERYGECV